MLDFSLGLLKFVGVSQLDFRLQGAFPMTYPTVNLEISTSEIKWNAPYLRHCIQRGKYKSSTIICFKARTKE